MSLPDDQSSDEEVFFGKLSLKEVKKHILWSDCKRNPKKIFNEDNDLRIIETHSEPDLNKRERHNLNINTVSNTNLSPNTPILYSNWDLKTKDDSFLKVEKMVTDLCISHESEDKVEQLNNTLDIIDYILKNGANSPSDKEEKVKTKNANEDEAVSPITDVPQQATPLKNETPTYYTPLKKVKTVNANEDEAMLPVSEVPHQVTPLKNEMPTYYTPLKKVKTLNANEDEAVSPITEVPQQVTPLKNEMPTYYTPLKKVKTVNANEDEAVSPITEVPQQVTPLKNEMPTNYTHLKKVKTVNANEDEAVSPITEVPQQVTPLKNEMPTYYTPLKKVKTVNANEDEAMSPITEVPQQATLLKNELPTYFTPLKNELNSPKKIFEHTATPAHNKQQEVFKTPKNPLSQKKASAISLKKTPSRNNAYQHIASPVASYIKNCPIAPLVKDVRPMKPLPGSSSIPKFVKAPPTMKSNSKENINLPSIAYKSAKKTKVIDAPDEEKLPTTRWMKKITSSLPKPVILKHSQRENHVNRVLGPRQEDSFGDLSLCQADVSVCTKKSAFNKPKLPL